MVCMATDRDGRTEPQQLHWDTTYAAHPAMYGDRPSDAAVYAAKIFGDASTDAAFAHMLLCMDLSPNRFTP